MTSERKKPKKFNSFATCPPDPIIPSKHSNCGFMDIEAIEFARQMTLLDYRMYSKMKPREFLGEGWVKKNKEELAPNVIEVISNFNSISDLVGTLIVSEEDLKERVLIWERWVEVAMEFRSLNNFDGVMKILSGLGKSGVYRLRLTKSKLKKKTISQMEELEELMKPSKGSSSYRTALNNCSGPAIPYLGLYLSDLVFISDGNSDFMKDENGEESKEMINFQKRRLTAKVIHEIQRYQQTPFNLVELPFVIDAIQGFSPLPTQFIVLPTKSPFPIPCNSFCVINPCLS